MKERCRVYGFCEDIKNKNKLVFMSDKLGQIIEWEINPHNLYDDFVIVGMDETHQLLKVPIRQIRTENVTHV